MEEQKQNKIDAPVEHGEGGKSHNRNRRRHHNRNHKPKNEAAQASKASPRAEEAAPSQKEQKAAKPQQQGKQNRNNQTAPTAAQGGEGSRNHKKRNHNRKKNGERDKGGRGVEKALYSPYEEPSPEELSLDELRARIVLGPSLGASEKSSVREEETTAIEIDSLDGYPPVDHFSVSAGDAAGEKIEVVGIRFRASGKMYYFDPRNIKAKKGDFAIVETARGPEFGSVCLGNSLVAKNLTVSPLRPLLRIATEADIAHNEENRKKEAEALKICQERVLSHKLDMKLIDVQYAFDNSKLLFYFTSEGRVDFRDLVKDLASIFRTRIELRQIGVRDETKMLGGLGACGRALCCSTFLPDFAQVSIKMAKEQNLSLNSSKISGCCGRLMCCLRFESDVYTEEIKKTPPVDAVVKTEDGIGYVISTNPLAGTIRVVLKDTPDVAPKQYHRNNVTVLEKNRKHAKNGGKENEKD